jgi:hypothetical protein
VPAVWPFVREHIARAVGHSDGTFDAAAVLEKLLSGDWILLLLGDDAAACVEVCQYPRSLTVRVPIIGGSGMREWMPALMDAVESWARKIGADRVEGCGRKGWTRVAPGYEIVAHIISKRL